MDRKADVPIVEIGLLRSLPVFTPLPAPELESIARSLIALDVPVGAAVISEGEPVYRYYIVADGGLEVTEHGRVVANLGRGDGFGEIALLHHVPRTATCRATSATHLYALERDDFLAAVTGHPQVADEAHRLAAERMGPASKRALNRLHDTAALEGEACERLPDDAVCDERGDVPRTDARR